MTLPSVWRIAAIALALFSVRLAGQQPQDGARQPVFRAGTDVVRLEVTVLDADRRPVEDLTAADFTVTEDGNEQPIVAFTRVDLPPLTTAQSTAAWVTEAPIDAVSNVPPGGNTPGPPTTALDEGRLVVIAFDWSIRFYDQERARRIAHAAVDNLGPTDKAAVIFTHGAANAGVPQNFTSDRSLLRRAIDRPFAAAETDLLPAGGNPWKLADPERYQSGSCHCGTCTLDALARIADTLRDVSQRPKVVLFIGTYVRTYESPMGQRRVEPRPDIIQPGAALLPSTCHAPLADARDRLERAMGEANATIHVLDPVGLETAETTPLGTADRIRERQDSLPVIADLTGGRTVMSTNDPQTHVPAILEESSSYYVLGFRPAATEDDDRSHRIEVRVNRPGVSVKARNRYRRTEAAASLREAAGDELVRALGGVLPATDVPLEMSAIPMIVGEHGATIVVGRVSTRTAGGSDGPLEVVTAAFTPRGRPAASRRVTLRPRMAAAIATADAGKPAALGLVAGLPLEPGQYEVRMGVERASGLGSVSMFVDIPDFEHERLALSGVLLHVAPEEAAEPTNEIEGMLPFVPTARRTFTTADTVSTFMQIGQGTTRTHRLEPVVVLVTIRDEAETIVRQQEMTVRSDAFAATRSTNLRLTLPTRELPAGRYLLTIEARTSERTLARSVRFAIAES